MHTFNGNKTRIHFNSDFSGDCEIVEKETSKSVNVPCDEIIEFVAHYVRTQKIDRIWKMSDKDVLGIKE